MSSTVICRLCLNTNRRSYFINHTVLQETWERLTDAKFDSKDGRPLLACYICCAQLRNSYQLRKRALKAEELFTKYIPNNGFEDSKTLVSLIVGNTCNNDYNYAIEEQHNLDSGQKVPERVEEVKKEIEDEDINIKEQDGKVLCYLDEAVTVKEEVLEVDEIDIKEEIEDNIEENNGESGMVYVKTEILPDDEDTLTNRSLEETLQRGDQIVLERIDSSVTAKKSNPEDVHQTTMHIKENNKERKPPNNAITSQPKELNTTNDEHISNNVHGTAKDISNSYTNVNVFSCKLCDYETLTKRSYNVHLRKQHAGENPYGCDLCDYRASVRSDLRQHITSKHKKENNFACHICQKIFSTKSRLMVHLRNHTGEKPYKCDLCDLRTADSANLKRHVFNVHKKRKNYACHICEKQFDTRRGMNKHVVEHTAKKPHNTTDKNYECDVCKKIFLCKRYLKRHLRRHSDEKPYKCDSCDYRTYDYRNLKQHSLFKHIKEKKYSCHICQKNFITKAEIVVHLRVHTGEKPYKCDLCDHRTSNSQGLKSHIKFKHTKEKSYSCHICQKSFVTKSEIVIHLRLHTGEKPYKCHLCDHRTTDSSRLRQHLKWKHKQETNYPCLICQKKCLNKNQLSEHLRVHTEEKM